MEGIMFKGGLEYFDNLAYSFPVLQRVYVTVQDELVDAACVCLDELPYVELWDDEEDDEEDAPNQ